MHIQIAKDGARLPRTVFAKLTLFVQEQAFDDFGESLTQQQTRHLMVERLGGLTSSHGQSDRSVRTTP